MKIVLKQTIILRLLICLIAFSFSANAQISISNEADLKAIANNLNATYILTNDIELTEEWTPIGKGKPFAGILKGENHVIRNLKISGGSGSVGLFAETYGAFIQNLGIENVEINSPDATNVGIIVGKATASYLENSYVSNAKIEGNNVGSFIGLSLSRGINPTVISNSYATSVDIKSGTAAGGIVAIAEGGAGTADGAAVESVYFYGTIEAKTLCGGIVASTKGKNTVSDCLVLAPELKGQESDPIVAKKVDEALVMRNNYFEKDGILIEYDSNTPLTELNVKSADFYKKRLYWGTDKWNIREGFYPLVSWQKN